jgi:hypothetical protein
VGDHLPGTVLALVAALLFGLGSVLQHEAAARAAAGGRLRMRTLVRQRTWLLGQVATTTGTGAQVAALALAPVALVQPLLAGALVAALGVRAVRTRRLPSRTEWAGAVLTVGGLVVFVVAARPGRGMPEGPPSGWAPVVAVAVVVLAVAATARLAAGPGPALACGVTGGLAAGVLDVLTHALDGLRALLLQLAEGLLGALLLGVPLPVGLRDLLVQSGELLTHGLLRALGYLAQCKAHIWTVDRARGKSGVFARTREGAHTYRRCATTTDHQRRDDRYCFSCRARAFVAFLSHVDFTPLIRRSAPRNPQARCPPGL